MSKSKKELWTPFRRPQLFVGAVSTYDEQMAEVLNRYIRPLGVDLIIEYGCGDGCWIEYLAEKYPLKHFFGYEWNKTLINIARKRCGNLDNTSFVEADISLKWHEGCDLFFAFGVLEHFEMHVTVLKDLISGLNRGGVCVLNVPNLAAVEYCVKRHGLKKEDLAKDRVVTKSYGYEELWSPKYFVSMLQKAGLKVLEHWVTDRWWEHNQVAACLHEVI